MLKSVLCLACGVICADTAFAQPVINPQVLAPTPPQQLPQSDVTVTPPQGVSPAKQKRPRSRVKPFIQDEVGRGR